MGEHGGPPKETPLPIYTNRLNDRHKPRRTMVAERDSHSRSSDEISPKKKMKKVLLTEGCKWNLLWVLFVVTFAIGIVCLAVLGYIVQNEMPSNNEVRGGDSTKRGFFTAWKENQGLTTWERLSNMFATKNNSKTKYHLTEQERRNLGEYECIGWRQTHNCTPSGERNYSNDKNCSALISAKSSGYCEVRNTRTKEVNRVLAMHCDSLRPGVRFSCDMFQSILSRSILSTSYEHDPNFSYMHNQEMLRTTNHLSDTPILLGNDGMKNESVGQLDRGIVFVIYEKLLLGAYTSVRSLRALGCTLPIEMWYKTSETNAQHPLLRAMVEQYNVYLRVIDDPLAKGFYTKVYAIFYSAFDNILLLDADNFAVRDPNYLFDTQEFVETGAIFWPDYWNPRNTIFNIKKNSFVWDYLGLDYVDMFEQESGQVMINRRMHYKALNVLMYYSFSLPRIHDKMRLVWGDKDLFRFAWIKSKSSFYMTPRPPGSAGTKHAKYDLFCGVTIVQYDPMERVMFLHRNTEKLTYINNRIVWTHIQQYKLTAPLIDYKIRGANGGKVFPQFKRCFGKDVDYEELFTLKPISAFPFENLEKDLLRFVAVGADILQRSGYEKKTTTTSLPKIRNTSSKP